MTPYFEQDGITIYHGDCRDVLPTANGVIMTDPPYNVGYHYVGGGDRRSPGEYDELLRLGLRMPSVVVAWPEVVYAACRVLGAFPMRSAAWVYPANTPRQWRLCAWFGLDGFPERVKQPYRNTKDRRIARLIEDGREARGYDWREIPQVKNVSSEKTAHPCQNPVEVMSWLIAATDGDVLIDPFMGSGTTLVAAKRMGRKAIGIELEERYCEIAAKRLSQGALPMEFTA